MPPEPAVLLGPAGTLVAVLPEVTTPMTCSMRSPLAMLKPPGAVVVQPESDCAPTVGQLMTDEAVGFGV